MLPLGTPNVDRRKLAQNTEAAPLTSKVLDCAVVPAVHPRADALSFAFLV